MSSLLRTSIIRNTAFVSRSFPRTMAARTISDNSTSSRHGNDPEVIERNKQSLLNKHSKNSKEDPHWHEELASDAEAFVKSQRDEIDASADAISKLQESTKKIPDSKISNKQ